MPVTQRPLDGRGITIGQVLDRTARKYPHNTAIVHSELDVTYTYRLLLSEANRVAKGLIQIGTKKGDRVGLRALNVPEWIISQMALAKIGAVLVPIDPGLKTEDLHYILEQAGCGFLIMAGGPQYDEYINTLCKIPYRSLLEKVIVIDEEPCPGMTTWNELREIGDEVDGETLVKRERSSANRSGCHHVHLRNHGQTQGCCPGPCRSGHEISLFGKAAGPEQPRPALSLFSLIPYVWKYLYLPDRASNRGLGHYAFPDL